MALADFVDGHPDACLIRYEDLVAGPEATLAPVYDLLGVARQDSGQIDAALAAPARIGLGDWKTWAEPGFSQGSVGRWQKVLSRRAAGGLMGHLAAPMARFGYAALPVPKPPTRSEALRQFGAAARLAAAPKSAV
jgi:hypothetical protein